MREKRERRRERERRKKKEPERERENQREKKQKLKKQNNRVSHYKRTQIDLGKTNKNKKQQQYIFTHKKHNTTKTYFALAVAA